MDNNNSYDPNELMGQIFERSGVLDINSILTQINLTYVILERFRAKLLGFKLNQDGEVVVDEDGKPIRSKEPLITEEGAENLINILYSALNENNLLSDFDDFDISVIGSTTCDAVAVALFNNAKEWGVTPTKMVAIMTMTRNLLLGFLKKAKYGVMFKTLNENLFVKETDKSKFDKLRGYFL